MDGPGQNSYPLASYTYVLVNKSWDDCDTSTRVLTFLDWCMNTSAPRARAQSFDLVPLPAQTIALIEEELRTLTCANGTLPALPGNFSFFLSFLFFLYLFFLFSLVVKLLI